MLQLSNRRCPDWGLHSGQILALQSRVSVAHGDLGSLWSWGSGFDHF